MQHKKLVLKLALAAIVMFAFSYMLVPLYTLVCKQTGINGRSSNEAAEASERIDTSRSVRILFTTTVHGNLVFEFKPLVRAITLHPGQQKLVYFYAHNTSGRPITVQAIPSITPDETAKYLKKTQCFCFTQQYFFENEKADMPVYFYVSPDLPSQYHDITLSYTLFDASHYKNPKQQFHRKGRIEIS